MRIGTGRETMRGLMLRARRAPAEGMVPGECDVARHVTLDATVRGRPCDGRCSRADDCRAAAPQVDLTVRV